MQQQNILNFKSRHRFKHTNKHKFKKKNVVL
jgi:hypothetical protein